ncbi:MAG: ATPase, T2SS/T4P/T4SS family [Candidatus Helarchaeota archaeon]
MEIDTHFILKSRILEDHYVKKDENLLICDCINCNFLISEKNIFENPNCIGHCLRILNKINNKEINQIKINTRSSLFVLNRGAIKILVDLINNINYIYNDLENFIHTEKLRRNNCKNYINCKRKIDRFLKNTFSLENDTPRLYKEPIKGYNELLIEKANCIRNYSENCINCQKNYLKFLNKSINTLEKTLFFHKYNFFKGKNQNLKQQKLFELILEDIERISKTQEEPHEKNWTLRKIKNYRVGPFDVNIFEDDEFIENYYEVQIPYMDEECKNIQKWIENKLKIHNYGLNDYKLLKLNESLNRKIDLVKVIILKELNHLEPQFIDWLSCYISFKTTGFLYLFPFLIDDDIEEIFLDKPNTHIYIDHRVFGRCRSNIILSDEEIKKFITIVRLESNQSLDEMHPSIKADLITDFFQVRVSIIIDPLASDGKIIIIRKLKQKNFSLTELIKNKTLSVDAAAYLLFGLYHGRNIVVIGPPGSGKTTLINTLDNLTPSHWRKLYIEDVKESTDQTDCFQHQIRLSVGPNSINKANLYSKEYQVRQALHRTPDMIYLGELIEKSAVKAFFFLLKVGLRCGLCTCHGESPELIIKRWMIEDNISIESIKDLDIIVQLAKISTSGYVRRRVLSISELNLDDSDNFKINFIYKRNAAEDNLESQFNTIEKLYKNSSIIKKIVETNIIHFDLNEFYNEFTLFKTVLQYLLANNIFENKILNKIFNRYWILKNKKYEGNWDIIRKELFNYINQKFLGDS